MKKYTLDDLKPYDPFQKTMDRIFDKWDRQKPLQQELDVLFQESQDLLGQIIELEEEMKTKPFFEALKIRFGKISPLNAKLEKNRSEIDKIYGKLIAISEGL